ncbi:MAG: sigma-54-dependent Fis family transcriptional regulator, partial [Bacteroidales bacterium]|nr:sigma-54-dependent Fis family transcriptional regulator [Bacteroidales bacterium]
MGKFREDLYYRLNAITIQVPSLKQRPEDIELLFRKFSTDISEKYHIPPLTLNDEARRVLLSYPWPGNIRELKNISEQITIIEKERPLSAEALQRSLPKTETTNLPVLLGHGREAGGMSEREILYSVLFDMQKDIQQLKQAVSQFSPSPAPSYTILPSMPHAPAPSEAVEIINTPEVLSEDLSLGKGERLLIEKALEKNNGNRRKAAAELGISERTIYRKIKEYGISLEE